MRKTIEAIADPVTPQRYEYEGVCFTDATVTKDTLDKMPDWRARRDDVFVVTYPKAGWYDKKLSYVFFGIERNMSADMYLGQPSSTMLVRTHVLFFSVSTHMAGIVQYIVHVAITGA